MVNIPRQRGFTLNLGYFLGALVVLAIAARFVWWVATEEKFGEVFTVLWIIGFVFAYWITGDNLFVVRMPAGFAVFMLLGLGTVPLTWMGESRIALVALILAQLAFSYYAGPVLSHRLRARFLARNPAGGEPAWLRQGGDVVADFGQWVLLALGAFVLCAVAPLIILLVVSLIVDLSHDQVKWAVVVWGIAAITVFGYQGGAARWGRLPACAWIYLAVTAVVLTVDAVAGPFAKDTGAQAAYIAVPGALVAAFVEVFVFGSRSKIRKEEDAT